MPFHVDRHSSIPQAFFALAERSPELIVYEQAMISAGQNADNSEARVRLMRNYSEVGSRVKKIAAKLVKLLERPDLPRRVAILSNTRPEWMEIDLAILSLGAVTVAPYHSLSDDELAYILFDSEAKIVFAENSEQVNKLLRIQEQVWKIPATEDRPSQEARIQLQHIIAIETVASHPQVSQLDTILEGEMTETLDLPLANIQANDLATLVYTSGTTGPPKGVMQTHRNHLSNIRQVYDAGIVREGSTVLLFLPLAHSFARLMGMIGFLTPVRILFPAVFSKEHSRLEPRSVLRDMRELSANVVPIVPRFLEKMEEGIRSRANRSSLAGRALRFAISIAERSYDLRLNHEEPTTTQSLLFRSTAPIRHSVSSSLFGPNFQFAVSGGAKLPVAIAKFFQALEIQVLEGYGLTETCVATNFNPLGKNKLGTVGPVLSKDIEQKIEADGEIAFRGPNISLGYWQRPTATSQSWTKDGWFHTGDLGLIDNDGYLSIIGRKKDIIVTSGGKKIAPQALEEKLKAHPQVSQAVVLGDGKPFCVALVTTRTALEAEQKMACEVSIREYIQEMNKDLASFETIKNFHIIEEDFSVENGLLTPTLKVKRKLVEQRYLQELEDLYKRTVKPGSQAD